MALAGQGQGVEGITFQNGAGLSGAFALNWVSIVPGGFDATVRDCEFNGGYGGNTAGGAAITSYTSVTGVPQVRTTLGAAVGPGWNTVTPGPIGMAGTGMAGIYIGKRLVVSAGEAGEEDVIVTARNGSSFTALFAHAHSAVEAITDRNNSTQRIRIENNYIHDCFACSGMVLNSGGAVVSGNKIVNVGLDDRQHGIYVQSGNNRIEDNWIEGVSGFGIHGHKAVPGEDASGDVYQGNTIVNYARQCIIVDSIVSSGNPEVARGEPLTRYATIANNTCRILKGAGSRNIVQGIGVQIGGSSAAGTGGVLIVNNILEDACGTTPNCVWISTGSFHDAAVSGNHLRMLNGGAARQTGISSNGGGDVAVTGNIVENWNAPEGPALYLGSNTTAIGNIVGGAAGSGPMAAFSGANIIFCNNAVTQAGLSGLVAAAVSSGVRICGNTLSGPEGSAVLDLTHMESGAIYDNSIVRGYMKTPAAGGKPALQIYNNDGELRWTGVAPSHAVAMTRSMGRLMAFPAGANPLTAGLAVAGDGSGNLLTASAAGLVFQGFAVQDKTAAEGSAYIVARESAEFDGAWTDGAWTAGHFGILSAASAGKIHDYGAVPPPAGYSYVQFLDSGASAGSARVLLARLGAEHVAGSGWFTFAATFARLPRDAPAGTLVYCTDCKNLSDDGSGAFDSPAAPGGHGTNVLYENRSWRVR